jgi:hypothetical protein
MLTFIRQQLQSIQRIKLDIDKQREEYTQILEIAKNKKQTEAAQQSFRLAEEKEDRAKKDQEYLLNRLKQLGISPQRQ